MFCGAGCAGAHDGGGRTGAKLKAPIVHSLRGKEHVEYDNPYDVGMTGLVGFASGYWAMKKCDTLLLLGTDFPVPAVLTPRHARIAQIDIRPDALGNRCPLDLGMLGAVKETLRKLSAADRAKRPTSAHLNEALEDYRKARADLDALAESGPDSSIIHPQYVTRVVSELAEHDDAIFTCDVGTPIAWTARYLKMNGTAAARRLVQSRFDGQCHAAGDRRPGRLSARQVDLHVRRWRVHDDDGRVRDAVADRTAGEGRSARTTVRWDSSRLEMKASGFLDSGCDLKNPNFAAMAQAMGIKGVRVERPQDLRAALTGALGHNGPALVDVVSARQELVMPPKTTADEAHKFGMFMLKAVLDGRAGELIDLAKVNLRR